jgi:lysophospholipase L1-like esterase
MGKLFFFGDSHVAGVGDLHGVWAGQLSRKLIEDQSNLGYHANEIEYYPYSLGVRGNRIEDVLSRIDTEIEARLNPDDMQEPVRIIISAGLNDCLFINKEQRSVTEIELFTSRVEDLLHKASKFSEEIYFIGLLPVDESLVDPLSACREVSFKNKIIKSYNDKISKVCQQHKIPFLSLFDEVFSMPNYRDLLFDGIHPKPALYDLLANRIERFVFKKSA